MKTLLLLFVALLAAPLSAQGGAPVPIQPEERPASGFGDNDPPKSDRSDEEIRELVRDEITALRRESGFLFSAGGIDLWAFGGVAMEYRHSDSNRRAGTLRPAHAAGAALDLDYAWLGVEGSYFDTNGFTDMQLATARIELAYERDELSLNRAWLGFNRPLTRFDLPFFKDYLSDSIQVGLDQPFWANRHRVSENYSLLDEALSRDEQVQATWTFSYGGWFYLLGGISAGSRLSADGEVNETRNYALLQDDRESYFDMRSNPDETTDSVGALFGTGVAIDLGGHGAIIPQKRIWRPHHASEHTDVLHLLGWWSYDTLAVNERTLIESVTLRASDNQTKWRLGLNAELALSRGLDALYLRAGLAHANDGDLSRNFVSLEGSYAFDLGEAFPMLTVIQPMLRASWMHTNAAGPLVDNSTPVASADAIAAGIAADRFQLTAAVKLWFHRRIALSIEYTSNSEKLNTPTGVDDGVDNDVFLLSLSASF